MRYNEPITFGDIPAQDTNRIDQCGILNCRNTWQTRELYGAVIINGKKESRFAVVCYTHRALLPELKGYRNK